MPATKPPPFACKIEGISNNDGPLKDVRCQGSLSPSAVRDYAYPLERHLVVVHIYEPGSACGGGDVDSWRVFGLVDKAKPGNVAGGTLLNVTMKVCVWGLCGVWVESREWRVVSGVCGEGG